VRAICLLAVLGPLLTACGATGLSAGFNGLWLGTVTVTSAYGTDIAEDGHGIWIDAMAGAADVEFVCPQLDGSLTAEGAGNDAQWRGVLLCDPFPTKACDITTLTLESMALHYDAQREGVTLDGRGHIGGCGREPRQAKFLFVGNP
jgi:hypothetical protein